MKLTANQEYYLRKTGSRFYGGLISPSDLDRRSLEALKGKGLLVLCSCPKTYSPLYALTALGWATLEELKKK